jgi:hypothetical protein
MTDDPEKGWVTAARAEIAEGMAHEKCHACGCMHDGLARLERVLEATEADLELLSDVRDWQAQLTAVTARKPTGFSRVEEARKLRETIHRLQHCRLPDVIQKY